jgi:hypothetical protein
MPGRRYDDTPLPDDPGMVDRGRPQMNQLGRWMRRELLDPLGVSHRANFENDTITVESVRDFLVVAREYCKVQKLASLPMALGEEELAFIAAHQDQTIRIRVAGDGVPTVLRIAANAFASDAAGNLFFDPKAPVDLQAVLLALAEAEAGSTEARTA